MGDNTTHSYFPLVEGPTNQLLPAIRAWQQQVEDNLYRNIPIGSQLPIEYHPFGNSNTKANLITDGGGTCYADLIGQRRGWVVTNHGVGKSMAADAGDLAYAFTPSLDKITSLSFGTNDKWNYLPNGFRPDADPTKLQEYFRKSIMGLAAWLSGVRSKATDSAAVKTGTWAANTGHHGNIGLKSSDVGAQINYEFTGRVWLLEAPVQDGNDGEFTVAIDGVPQGTFKSYEDCLMYTRLQLDAWEALGNTDPTLFTHGGYGGRLLPFPGLSDGTHVATIEVTAGTVYIDWMSGVNAGSGFPVVVFGVARESATGYLHQGGDDTNTALYNQAARLGTHELAAYGLPVVFFELPQVLDNTDDAGDTNPITSTHDLLESDSSGSHGIHWSQQAHIKVANGVLELLSPWSGPKEKQALRCVVDWAAELTNPGDILMSGPNLKIVRSIIHQINSKLGIGAVPVPPDFITIQGGNIGFYGGAKFYNGPSANSVGFDFGGGYFNLHGFNGLRFYGGASAYESQTEWFFIDPANGIVRSLANFDIGSNKLFNGIGSNSVAFDMQVAGVARICGHDRIDLCSLADTIEAQTAWLSIYPNGQLKSRNRPGDIILVGTDGLLQISALEGYPGDATKFANGAGGWTVPGVGTYAPLASPAFTGTPTAPTAAPGTNTTQLATTAFVSAAISLAVTGLLEFIGDLDCSANPNYPAANKGDSYVVTVAGKVGGASGKSVDVGDLVVAKADNAGGTQAAVGGSWFIVEHNLVGALLTANNLSDLTDFSVARTNLGLAIGTNVQAYSAELAAIAGLSSLANDQIIQRKSGAWANRTPAQFKTDLALVSSDVGLGSVTNDAQTKAAVMPNTAPAAGQIPVGNAGGTAYAPKSLSGDVTLDSTGAVTIANAAVTLAKMANMATSSLIYRKTAGSGAPEVNTLATLKTDLGLTGTNSGDQDLSALAPKADPSFTGQVRQDNTSAHRATFGKSSGQVATTAATATITAALGTSNGNREGMVKIYASHSNYYGTEEGAIEALYRFRSSDASLVDNITQVWSNTQGSSVVLTLSSPANMQLNISASFNTAGGAPFHDVTLFVEVMSPQTISLS